MSIRNAIYDLLNDTEADVYPFIAPQELKDSYAVYNIRKDPIRTQDGIGPFSVDLSLAIYDKKMDDCIALADSLATALEGAEGSYGGSTIMGTNWVSEDGDYLEELMKYVITQEYQLFFT